MESVDTMIKTYCKNCGTGGDEISRRWEEFCDSCEKMIGRGSFPGGVERGANQLNVELRYNTRWSYKICLDCLAKLGPKLVMQLLQNAIESGAHPDVDQLGDVIKELLPSADGIEHEKIIDLLKEAADRWRRTP